MENNEPPKPVNDKIESLVRSIQQTKVRNKQLNFSLESFIKDYKPRSRRKSHSDY